MRGRSCTQPFLVEKSACRPDALLLPPRWANRSPPHPTRLRRPTYGLWWLRLDLTEQSPGLFDPRGEGFGRGSFPAEHPILPPNRLTRQGTPRRVSPPAGGERKCNHVLTGSAGQNILLSPRVPALLARVGLLSPNFGSPAQRVPKFLPFPARPAGGRAVTGVRYRAAGQSRNIEKNSL